MARHPETKGGPWLYTGMPAITPANVARLIGCIGSFPTSANLYQMMRRRLRVSAYLWDNPQQLMASPKLVWICYIFPFSAVYTDPAMM